MGFERLTELRKEKGLTIEQLSELSGVPTNTIKKISAGINTNPTLDTVKALAKALQCSLDEFGDIEKSPEPSKNDSEDFGNADQLLIDLNAALVRSGFIRDGEDIDPSAANALIAVIRALFRNK